EVLALLLQGYTPTPPSPTGTSFRRKFNPLRYRTLTAFAIVSLVGSQGQKGQEHGPPTLRQRRVVVWLGLMVILGVGWFFGDLRWEAEQEPGQETFFLVAF